MLRTYDQFLIKYSRILANAASILKPKHLAAVVVGNVRERATGRLHSLTTDTISALQAAGCSLYNEGVLLTAIGTAAMRAEQTMSAASKLVNTHQSVVCFTKGASFTPDDARRIGIRANEDEVRSQPQR